MATEQAVGAPDRIRSALACPTCHGQLDDALACASCDSAGQRSGRQYRFGGFTDDELDAIRRFVAGGPVEDLLQRLGSGAGLPGGLMGGVTGGIAGAVALPVVGGVAKRAANNQARRAADLIRAQVATPGGIPMRPQPPRLPAPPMAAAGGLTANASLPDLRKSMVGSGRS